jgi:two-component system KDP operon response regulator KdpE
LARIRSVLRRSANRENDSVIDCGDLQIDLASRIVRKNNTIVKLTSTEYSLLALLAKNDSKVLTHKNILKIVWGPTFGNETQYLRVFVAQLRKKIESNPNQPKYIITEAGVGYRFMAKE